MNKKRTAILAVALFFCLAALCGILFTGRQKEKPEEKTPAYEDEKKQGEDGDARQYKFKNLENIYYLPDDKEEFEKEVYRIEKLTRISNTAYKVKQLCEN